MIYQEPKELHSFENSIYKEDLINCYESLVDTGKAKAFLCDSCCVFSEHWDNRQNLIYVKCLDSDFLSVEFSSLYTIKIHSNVDFYSVIEQHFLS